MKDRTSGSWWPLNHWTDSKTAGARVVLQSGSPAAVGDVAPGAPDQCGHRAATAAFGVGQDSRGDQPVPQATPIPAAAATNSPHPEVANAAAITQALGPGTREGSGV